jgi:hypothetical protein
MPRPTLISSQSPPPQEINSTEPQRQKSVRQAERVRRVNTRPFSPLTDGRYNARALSFQRPAYRATSRSCVLCHPGATFSLSARRQCRFRQRQCIGREIIGALAGRIGASFVSQMECVPCIVTGNDYSRCFVGGMRGCQRVAPPLFMPSVRGMARLPAEPPPRELAPRHHDTNPASRR